MVRTAFIVLGILGLIGCAQRSVPAPISVIDTAVSDNDKRHSQNFHVVQSNETLYGIAWLYGKDYQELAQLNNLTEPYHIQIGQRLNLSEKVLKQPSFKADTSSLEAVKSAPKSQNSVASTQTEVYRSDSTSDNSSSQVASTKTLPSRVARWVWPTEGKIVGQFSTAEAGNSGLLIANTIGTPVVSAAKGKVVYVGDALRGYGNLVIIKHTDTYLSAYAHNNKILVEERQFVKAGEMIAEMGNSGTTEAMLRFEIRFKGKSQDPQRFLPRK